MMELKRLSLEPNYQWHRNENDSQYATGKTVQVGAQGQPENAHVEEHADGQDAVLVEGTANEDILDEIIE